MTTDKKQAGETPRNDAGRFHCSHALRLSGREWLVVAAVFLAMVALAPVMWERFERFDPDADYRLPYELTNDYWLYQRYNDWACQRGKVLVVGDSVVWGHYVPPAETLPAYLNDLAGGGRFANLGLDGTHPAALAGLLAHYGRGLSGRKIVLHFNPLWLTSARHDLQTTKEFHFNHAELVAQFRPRIPCYKAPFAKRLRIAAGREIPFANWMAHMRTTYFDGMDLPAWTLENPYRNPLASLTPGLPAPAGPPDPAGGSWVDKGAKKQPLAWVELGTSLQWQFFRRTIDRLRERENDVFVLVGPFNEHMLNERDATRYNAIKTGVESWCRENSVPCFVPSVLPAEYYVDASHPVGQGYDLLAQQLWTHLSFQSFLGQDIAATESP